MSDNIITNLYSAYNTVKWKAKETKRLDNEKTIKICPLWAYNKGGSDKISNTLALSVSPSEVMFTHDSDSTTLKLMNNGEYPVNMNRKLATWSVQSMFMKDTGKDFFDLSNDNGQQNYDAYGDYCRILYDWKNNQTPLVFIYPTWGNYYFCQIKYFKFGNKDGTGNVYYELQFQEYKKYDKFDTSYGSTDYSSDTYYCDEGDTILSVSKKMYGSTKYFYTLIELNNLTDMTLVKGQALKVR